jgi:hypothetical protein
VRCRPSTTGSLARTAESSYRDAPDRYAACFASAAVGTEQLNPPACPEAHKWVCQAEIDVGGRAGVSSQESAEVSSCARRTGIAPCQ